MKTAIIIHGTPDEEDFKNPDSPAESNKHWIPWLQNQLLIKGYHTSTPEMPRPYAPDYTLWKNEFDRYTVNADSLLVGHSCGGGFLLRWLSENPVPVKRVVLVAPWLDPQDVKCPGFFNFQIDPTLTERTDLHIFSSDDDGSDIQESVRTISNSYPQAHSRNFSGYGHFCLSDMGTDAFPELAEALVR